MDNRNRTALSPLFEIPDSLKKRAKNCLDVIYTKKINLPIKGYNEFNQVIPNLYIGVIPTKEEAIVIRKKIPQLGLVVSAVESFEFLDNQTPADWHSAGIDHHHVVIKDYTIDVSTENIFHAIQRIHLCLSQQKPVYVHCKAGKSRSATIVMAYLAVYQRGNGDGFYLREDASMEEVCQFLRAKRKQIVIDEHHLEMVSETVEHFNHHKHTPTIYRYNDDATPAENLSSFFASPLTKREISNFLSFKNIKHYAHVKNEERFTRFIQLFLSAIEHAENEEWFINLLHGNSHLHIVAATPAHGDFLQQRFHIGYPRQRLVLISDFVDDLLKLTKERLNISLIEHINLPDKQALNLALKK